MDTRQNKFDVKSLSVIDSTQKRGRCLTKTAGLLLATLPLLSMQDALADPVTWNGSQNNIWAFGGNWDGLDEPDVGDVAIFNASTPNDDPTSGEDVTIQGLEFDDAAFVLTNDHSMTLSTSGIVNNSGVAQSIVNNGILNIDGGDVAQDVTITNDGTLNVNNTDDMIINESIDGAGDLVYTSAADTKLTLAGGASYAGQTTVNSGNLQIGNAGADGDFASSGVELLTDTSTLTFNRITNDTIYQGLISGSGSLVQDGTNTLILTNDNTYWGSTMINSGNLQIGNDTDTGSLQSQSISVASGSSLIFYRSSDAVDLVYGGAISGEGSLSQMGAGVVILTGTNSYVGATEIADGTTLQVGMGGSSGSVSDDSAVSIGDGASFIMNHSSNVTYGGLIAETTPSTGTGIFEKAGTGTLTLTSDNSAYTGITNVGTDDNTANGTLLIDTDASLGGTINVKSGATLGGFGTVGTLNTGDVTIEAGGIMSPGASIGTVTVAGNYIQDGTYLVELNAAGDSDSLVVQDTATLTGDLAIDVSAGFDQENAYNILSATNGITGAFSNVDITDNVVSFADTPFLSGTIDTTTTANTILFTPSYNAVRFETAAQTPNQHAVADYLIASGGTSEVQALIGSITTDQQFQAAMDQISGATYANQALQLAQVGRWFNSQLADRTGFYPACEGVTDPKSTHSWPDNCPRHPAVWVLPYGSSATLDADDVSGLDTSMGGVAIGADMPIGDNGKIGAAFGGSYFSSDISGGNESGDDDGNLYQFGVYGSYQMNEWNLGGSLDIGFTNDIDATRNINAATGSTSVSGSYSASLIEEQIRLSYDKQMNQTRIRPFVGLVAQQVSGDSFSETGNEGFNLNVSNLEYDSFKSQLGVSTQVPAGSRMTFVGSITWQHEFADDQGSFDAYLNTLGGAESMNIVGTEIGTDSALVKAGFVVMQKGRMNATIMYEGVFADSYSENGGRLQLDFDLS